MSSLQLRYLASLREELGRSEERFEVPEAGLDFEQVLALIQDRHGPGAVAALTADSVRLACNQELVDPSGLHLRGGDELAFLPPVTGG